MKKIILLFATVAFHYSNIDAQISKGAILLGGDLSGYLQNQEVVSGVQYKNNGFMFSPLVGIATRQNLVQGGFLQIGVTSNKNDSSSDKGKTNNLGAGYFIRKYSVIKNNFYGFVQGNAGISYYKNKYEYSTGKTENSQKGISLDLSPGLSFKVSRKLHLETGLRQLVSLSYLTGETKTSNQTPGDVQHFKQLSFYSSLNNFTSGLYFGFRLLLDKK